MRYLLGVDLGTSSTKTVLFDQNGVKIAESSREYPLSQPQNGWAEQNPEDWFQAALQTIRQVITQSQVQPEAIVSLGISGQMHGLVMLDESGAVLRPSIIWCDQRTASQCEEMNRRIGEQRLIELTCNPALTGFTAPKLLWVREHEPDIYARCRHILLPKDFLRYRLTGELATEVSDASGMSLLDVPNRCWSKEVLDKLEIDERWLARVYESPEVTGCILPEISKLTGLSVHTLVVGGAGDNAAAAVGCGVVRDGRAFTTIGTSGVVFAHTSNMALDAKGRVHTFCCAVPGAWHVMGVVQSAGLSMQWMRNLLYPEDLDYVQINQDIAATPIGANRLIYLPYLMGERTPHLNADCRGVFFGLSAIHQKPDMARAVMESVTYALKDSMEILSGMGVMPSEMTLCGGGSKSPLWRQMLCDVFGVNVCTPRLSDCAALGAAILAGVGAGLYPSVESACDAMVSAENRLSPDMEKHARYARVYEQFHALYPDMKDAFSRLKTL